MPFDPSRPDIDLPPLPRTRISRARRCSGHVSVPEPYRSGVRLLAGSSRPPGPPLRLERGPKEAVIPEDRLVQAHLDVRELRMARIDQDVPIDACHNAWN